jgi:4-amino-4-deoxy-L-arabinose transferase-like glycosyltransferase
VVLRFIDFYYSTQFMPFNLIFSVTAALAAVALSWGLRTYLVKDSTLNISARSQLFTLLGILLLGVAARGLTLEFMGLIDPSESRYALVAATMYQDNAWLVPYLPAGDGNIPFLSKPPLHYWLTAIAYSLFGIDEWTSRLPSFLALTAIIITIALTHARHQRSRSTGLLASLMLVTAPFPFFIFGGSTLDATLTAAVSCALLIFKHAVLHYNSPFRPWYFALFWVFAAAGFLIKGPIALVLIGGPIAAIWVFLRFPRLCSKKELFFGIAILIGATLPYFIALELATPGGLRYMFVNENIQRFLSSDYGDKFGDGHKRAYGSIWWMYAATTLPWVLLLLPSSIRSTLLSDIKRFWPVTNKAGSRLPELHDPEGSHWVLFLFVWSFLPAVFFTFARQVLPPYILPAIPGFFLLLASLITAPDTAPCRWTSWRLIGTTGLLFTILVTAIQLIGGSYLSYSKSSEKILRQIATQEPAALTNLGVYETENLSPFWLATTGTSEIPAPLTPHYATNEDVRQHKYINLLVREPKSGVLSVVTESRYIKVLSLGRWSWYQHQL